MLTAGPDAVSYRDNGFSYVKNRSLRELLARHGIRHLTTEPYRPRTNGKVERFHQTMAREWAYGLTYRSHRQRNQAPPHWLNHHNTRRPHSSLGDRPPISRVHKVRGRTSSPWADSELEGTSVRAKTRAADSTGLGPP
jgi:Integrase core domain